LGLSRRPSPVGPTGGSKVAAPRCSLDTNEAMFSSIGTSIASPTPVFSRRNRAKPIAWAAIRPLV
jgi:hypothetical protein